MIFCLTHYSILIVRSNCKTTNKCVGVCCTPKSGIKVVMKNWWWLSKSMSLCRTALKKFESFLIWTSNKHDTWWHPTLCRLAAPNGIIFRSNIEPFLSNGIIGGRPRCRNLPKTDWILDRKFLIRLNLFILHAWIILRSRKCPYHQLTNELESRHGKVFRCLWPDLSI